MNILTQALQTLRNIQPEEIAPTGAILIDVEPSSEDGTEWETHTGTRYPNLESIPWQARGSAVKVAAR